MPLVSCCKYMEFRRVLESQLSELARSSVPRTQPALNRLRAPPYRQLMSCLRANTLGAGVVHDSGKLCEKIRRKNYNSRPEAYTFQQETYISGEWSVQLYLVFPPERPAIRGHVH